MAKDDTDGARAGELRDAAAMRMLAHPMRIQILGSLRAEGPATSAILARRLRTDTGQTSFHLRLLNSGGFVEEMTDKGKGRERWWRAASVSTMWRLPSEYTASEVGTALAEFERAANTMWAQQYNQYLSERETWPPHWVDAAGSTDLWIRLTPERLVELRDEIESTIQRYDMGAQEAEDSSDVVILVNAFPRHRPTTQIDAPTAGIYGFGTVDTQKKPKETAKASVKPKSARPRKRSGTTGTLR